MTTAAASPMTELVHTQMPMCAALDIDVVTADRAEVVLRGRWDPRHCTVGGTLHGGYLMALADAAGAVCAHLNLPEGASTVTTSSTTHFLRRVDEGEVAARSTPVHVGRSSIVVQTDLVRHDGELVCRTTQAQAVLVTATSAPAGLEAQSP